MTFLDATIPGQKEPRSDDNEGVLHIPQSFKAGNSPSDCIMSYPGDSLRETYTSAWMPYGRL